VSWALKLNLQQNKEIIPFLKAAKHYNRHTYVVQKLHVSQIESSIEERHETVGEIELKSFTTLNIAALT